MQIDHRPDDPDDVDLTPTLRWMSNMLCYWAICDQRSCLRARACKGNPGRCLRRYAPLAPEEARFGLGAIMKELDRDLTQEEIQAAIPNEVAALESWQARVLESDARRRALCRR
jgi:hypothetical protein